jgi:hypothetical protein
MKNELTGQLYSSKFRISVVDLTNIELATKADKQRHRDLWAAFFKSKSWEELRMLAEKDRNIAEAIETVYELSEDERIRQRAEAREDYLRQQMDHDIWMNNEFARYKAALAEKEASIAEKENTIAEQAALIEALKKELEHK